MLLSCTRCTSEFHGRSDAKYCSPACRQQAYRTNSRDRREADLAEARALGAVRQVLSAVPRCDLTAKFHVNHALREALETVQQAILKDLDPARPAQQRSR